MTTIDTKIRDWVISLQPGAVFVLEDAASACPEKTRDNIKQTLRRLTQGEDPYLARLVRGLYSRRRVGERCPLSMEPEVLCGLPWMLAGPGAGFAPPNAMNNLGWSTQVPGKTNIVVVGRPPKPPTVTVRYWQRSNRERAKLTPTEVTLLEAVNGFDTFSEKSWMDALSWLKQREPRAQMAEQINPERFWNVAQLENYRGATFLQRCQEISDFYATT